MIDPFKSDSVSSLSRQSAVEGDGAKADNKQIAVLAQQFEAMLMTQMLREMKESMAPEKEEGGGFGADNLGDMVNSEFGTALTKSGGVGLADSLMKALQRLEPRDVSKDEQSFGMAPSPTPQAPSPDPLVSSSFGMRADPINGHQKFHKGTDIRSAYGQEVRAAAGGVVTFAGEQSGYGLVVKVDHGDGLETRYAHLSSADVRVGATVAAGSPIARSGNSGRTTGPHLHFEVRQDGQPIDPSRVTGFVSVSGNETAASR